MPAIQVLWVNCHRFFVLGPMVLAAYVAELPARRYCYFKTRRASRQIVENNHVAPALAPRYGTTSTRSC
jgi:uncharacterized membrane protein